MRQPGPVQATFAVAAAFTPSGLQRNFAPLGQNHRPAMSRRFGLRMARRLVMMLGRGAVLAFSVHGTRDDGEGSRTEQKFRGVIRGTRGRGACCNQTNGQRQGASGRGEARK
jgi:hypothetical protein